MTNEPQSASDKNKLQVNTANNGSSSESVPDFSPSGRSSQLNRTKSADIFEQVSAFKKQHKLSDAAADELTSLVKTLVSQQKIVVRVPATTANLGPGYDCCGIAVDVWNELIVERSSHFSLAVTGTGEKEIPRDETNLVCVGVAKAYEYMNKPIPILSYTCKNNIPFGKGLGSSSAAVVSGILAGLALEDEQLPVAQQETLLSIACEVEGHPDNVAPCIYGGFQLGYRVDDQWCTSRVRIPDGLVFVFFCPDHAVETKKARGVLNNMVPREDAVFNSARVALLVNCFCQGDLSLLKIATQDMLHQPMRGQTLHPHLYPILETALGAGAHGAFLSGAGPSVCAICSGRKGDVFTQKSDERSERSVAKAILKTADEIGCAGTVVVTRPVDFGGTVSSGESDLKQQDDARIMYF